MINLKKVYCKNCKYLEFVATNRVKYKAICKKDIVSKNIIRNEDFLSVVEGAVIIYGSARDKNQNNDCKDFKFSIIKFIFNLF